MKNLKTALMATASVAVLLSAPLAHAADAPAEPSKEAASPDSGTMDRADRDMKKVLEELQSLGGKPIETLTPAEARKQPTPTDAVTNLLKKDGKNPEELKAKMGVTTKDVTYPAGKGEQKARIYTPEGEHKEPLPVIVYYHGGGFVIADIDVYDSAPRSLAKDVNAIVVSVEYRHAPEAKFPAQHDDAFAAYEWVLKNASSWGGDPTNIAVAGESAGGNLAANTAIKARDAGIQKPVHMVLVYPVASNNLNSESYQENVNAKPLNKAMMEWFVKETIAKDADKENPMINLVAADLSNLPSATIITAEIDPLLSDGKLLADKLKEAGSEVDYKEYEGVTHEFFGMGAVVGDAKDAIGKAASNLKSAFKDNKK